MAYMNKEMKKEIAERVKPILKEYGMKGTFAIDNYSTFVVNIREGILFEAMDGKDKCINHAARSIEKEYGKDSKEVEFLTKLFEAINKDNYNNSNAMIDYFDVGYYVNVNIGRWNKPYSFKGE